MISEDEARTQVLQAVRTLPSRRAALSQALDCFAAQDYFARLPLPAFDNSAMDGYAVVASSCKKGGRLRVIGEQPAGPDRKLRVGDGEAVRIFTGATASARGRRNRDAGGCDARRRRYQPERGCRSWRFRASSRVRFGGRTDDFSQRRTNPRSDGCFTGVAGFCRCDRWRQSNCGSHFHRRRAGESRATNFSQAKFTTAIPSLLSALLQRCGVSATTVEHCRDDRQSLGDAIKRGMKNHVLIISGGVSVGEHDLVKEALRELGAKIEIWRVAVKPGKPFLFGRVQQSAPSPRSSPSETERRTRSAGEGSVSGSDCLIFGLPGNPVSAFVTFLQFVRPAILRMMGATNLDLRQVPAKLAVGLTNDGDRPHYIRGRLEHGKFTPIGRQESHALFGLSQANALLRVAVRSVLESR